MTQYYRPATIEDFDLVDGKINGNHQIEGTLIEIDVYDYLDEYHNDLNAIDLLKRDYNLNLTECRKIIRQHRQKEEAYIRFKAGELIMVEV